MPTQEQLDRPFDCVYPEPFGFAQDKLRRRAQDRMMQLDPGSDEFKHLLLEIAEGSDHPNDVAIAKILRKELGEKLGDSDGP